MKLELEAKRLEAAVRSDDSDNEIRPSTRIVAGRVRSPDLPSFVDGKDNLDSYLQRFERYAIIANWNRNIWATQLSALLSGNALDVYSRLSHEDALCYDKLKAALLRRYNFTENGYRQRFREAKPENQETPGHFIVRLKNYC